jgi:hypothetical protein
MPTEDRAGDVARLIARFARKEEGKSQKSQKSEERGVERENGEAS